MKRVEMIKLTIVLSLFPFVLGTGMSHLRRSVERGWAIGVYATRGEVRSRGWSVFPFTGVQRSHHA
jgi:hypothetical protein